MSSNSLLLKWTRVQVRILMLNSTIFRNSRPLHVTFNIQRERSYKIGDGNINKGRFYTTPFASSGGTINAVVRYSSNEAKEEKDERGSIVYVGNMTNSVMRLKRFTLFTSLTGLLFLPTMISKVCGSSITAAVGMTTFFSFSIIGTPLLIHWVTRRYVTEIKFNRETRIFSAKTPTLFCREKEIRFKASDVCVPEIPPMLTTFLVKNQPMLIDYKEFEDADAYEHLMGYDKPLDLRLSEASKDEKTG